MNGKNPFLIKYSDSINSETSFLSLFNSDTLTFIDKNFIKKESIKKDSDYENLNLDYFRGIHYIQSSPGAGKTSIFQAFSPSILQAVVSSKQNEDYKDTFKFMSDNELIDDNNVRLLTIYIPCARNYDILDEIFTNGRRKQAFFALLNCRIIISALRAICKMKNYDIKRDLNKVKFENLPDEMVIFEKEINDGKNLFKWACEEESRLCKFLDSLDHNNLEISFMHNTLVLIKIFEPQNIIIDGEKSIYKSLLIFDDFHKLSFNQREWLNDAVCQIRPDVAVWFGQRLEALSNYEIISGDGMIDREYQGIVNIESLWSEKLKGKFPLWLRKIADLRVKNANLGNLNSFEACLYNKLDLIKYRQKIESGIEYSINEIKVQSMGNINNYALVLQNIKKTEDLFEKSKRIMTLEIYIRRKYGGQLQLDLGEQLSLEEFEDFYKENSSVAEYYFCIRNKITYYYGIDRIIKLSSYNIEQFLSFCAGIFDLSITKSMNSRKKGVNYAISPIEQEKYIKTTANKRWEDIIRRFDLGSEVQKFILNIVKIADQTRNTYRNSYSGGAITGIGIERSVCEKLLNDNEDERLIEVLRICITARYLEKRLISQNNKEWYVFYLNRWICVKYDLPLEYGGWKPININKLKVMNLNNIDIDKYDNEMIAL